MVRNRERKEEEEVESQAAALQVAKSIGAKRREKQRRMTDFSEPGPDLK